MAEVILLDGQAHHAAGKAPPDAVAKYRQATDLLKTRVLFAADGLTTSNAAMLDGTYYSRRAGAHDAEIGIVVPGIALFAVLVAQALAALIAINNEAFDSAIRDGGRALSGWDVIPPAAVVLVVALVVAGVWPRLAEFR